MNKLRLFFICLCLVFFSLAINAAINTEKFSANKNTYHSGFYSFHHDLAEDRVYLEITEFNKPFIFQSSLPYGIGSNDIGFDRGQLGQTRLAQFERAGKKVFLRQLNTSFRSTSNNPKEQQSIKEAFASSIIWGFEIKKETDDKISIDYTDFLLSDIHNISSYLEDSEQGNYAIDPSRSAVYGERSKAFPNNTELEAIVTYKGNTTSPHLKSVTPDPTAITVHLHHSLIALPDNNYKPRKFHPYSGYWDERYKDYSTNIDQPITQRVITRHRLEKKNPKSKSSEAKNPIIYYLDSGVPEPIKSALIDGALWWNQGFEEIGFKNAFQIKILPDDADPMDVRYNVIQWVHRATRGWSYGSTVTDPRTGEILKGHVTLGSLRARQDYLIATGLTSPFNTAQADTSKQQKMALARIQQLSAHEVGHTLGIAHNFAASTNNRASVMDYPHPKIEIENGEISLKNAYSAGLGEWDKYVIAYGYSEFNEEQEERKLDALISTAQSQDLRYISDPDARQNSSPHAHGHLWDNGENATNELIHLLNVREIALNNFGINSIPNGTPFSELEKVLVPIYHLHRYQTQATASLIGGLNYSYATKNTNNKTNKKIVSSVSGAEQYRALNALVSTLDVNVLTIPQNIIQLIPPKAYGYERTREDFNAKTGISFDPVTAAEASAKHSITLLLNKKRLARVEQQAAMDISTPNSNDIIDTLFNHTVKRSAEKNIGLLIQQRSNHQVIQQLLHLWHDPETAIEVKAIVYQQLIDLQAWLQDNSKRRHNNKALYAHYRLLINLIRNSLSSNAEIKIHNNVSMPPGSPI